MPDRDEKGHFLPGHSIPGPGTPNHKQVAAFRQAVLTAVTPEDIEAVVKSLIEAAKAGEIPAIKELLDRTVGKVTVNMNIKADPRPYAELSNADLLQILKDSEAAGLLSDDQGPAALLPSGQ